MPNLNAAVACAQLEQIENILLSKYKTAQEYKSLFKRLDIEFVEQPKECKSSYWLNAIVLANKVERDKFLEQTNSAGVMTRPIWDLMSTLPMFKESQRDDLAVSKRLADTVVNIPSSVRV